MRSSRNATPSGSANSGAVEDSTEPIATPRILEAGDEQDRARGGDDAEQADAQQ